MPRHLSVPHFVPAALLLFGSAVAAAQMPELVITAKAPLAHPLDNPRLREVVRKRLGHLPDGLLKEKSQLEASINSKELFGESDPGAQKLLEDINRIYGTIKNYDRRLLNPQPDSNLEEPTLVSSQVGAFVYSVDISEDKAPRSAARPGDTGVFLRPSREGNSLTLKLIIGPKTLEQRLSPLKPLSQGFSSKVKRQQPAGVVRLAPIYTQDTPVALKGEFDLNYYAPQPENESFAHLASTVYLKADTLDDASAWHLQVLKRDSKTVLKSFIFETKEALALADFNGRLWQNHSAETKPAAAKAAPPAPRPATPPADSASPAGAPKSVPAAPPPATKKNKEEMLPRDDFEPSPDIVPDR